VRLWEAAGGKPIATLPHGAPVNAVAFSPDGRTVLTGSNDGARLWEAASGKEIATLHNAGGIWFGVQPWAFSPDGRTLLIACSDQTACLWEAASGKPIATLRHKGDVGSVAFSPDGRTVLTGSRDKTARLWEAASGKPLVTLRHEGAVHAVAFSPDGRTVLTGSNDGARLWGVVAPAPDEPERVRAWVRVRSGKAFDERGVLRPLTQAEWLQARQELDRLGGDWEPPPDTRRWRTPGARISSWPPRPTGPRAL
jgi:dipeptidyl aminopeptidase/acylaminoacyl peptidase